MDQKLEGWANLFLFTLLLVLVFKHSNRKQRVLKSMALSVLLRALRQLLGKKVGNLCAATAYTVLPRSKHSSVPPEQRMCASVISSCGRKFWKNN